MGSLSNLYISQSFISLIHLGSDNTASTDFAELQDGLGNGIGVFVNTEGNVSASNLAITDNILAHRGLEVSGTVKFNTEYTSSTPSYVNSGNYFTDYIIRITGSFASGTIAVPSVNEVQIGWIANGDGINNALVIDKQYVNPEFVELTIDQNTAVWFGEYTFTNPTSSFDNISVSGSQDITGSLWVRDKLSVTDISASGNISASNLWVKGRIHAYEMDVTIISSSIVFSSGSNIIGDNANEDVQLIIGRTIVTGSLEVTSSIKATNDISSSTISGIGNVTLYSQSVDNRLDIVEATASLYVPFSTSVNSRLVLEEATSSFLRNTFSASQYKTDSSSFDSRLDQQEAFSSSLVATFATVLQLNNSSSQLQTNINNSSSVLQSNINTKLDTSSFTTYSASVNSRINTIVTTYATTGSNTFVGNQVITGSLILSSSAETELTVIGNSVYTGSVRGNVTNISIVSNTASLDCSRGSFFRLTLPGGGANTRLEATNILPGETISLLVTCAATTSSISYPTYIKFPKFSAYTASLVPNAVDVVTFVTFDSTNLYGVNVKNMI